MKNVSNSPGDPLLGINGRLADMDVHSVIINNFVTAHNRSFQCNLIN